MRGIFTLEKSSGQGLFSVVWRQAFILLEVFSVFVGYFERLGKHYTYICISSGRLLSCSDMQCIQCSASCYSNMSIVAGSEENHVESY